MNSRKLLPWLAMAAMVVFAGLANGDFEKDKEECGNQLVGLATCLPYVSGEAKLPTMDCCSGLKQVLKKSRVCLCILIKDRNDPNLGLKLNATLALGLPDTCHAPSNITECPQLMNLPPNSPDAKIFEDYGKNAKSNATATTGPGNTSNSTIGSSGDMKSDVGRGKKWLGVGSVWGVLYIIITFLFQFV